MGAAIHTSNRSCKKGMYLKCRNWTVGRCEEKIGGTKRIFGHTRESKTRRYGRTDNWAHRARNFLMTFPPAWMLHRRRMNSLSVGFFFFCCSLYILMLSMYSLIINYIFIEEAWKRGCAGNEGLIDYVIRCVILFAIVIHIVIHCYTKCYTEVIHSVIL